MENTEVKKDVWFLEGPYYRYEQDVKKEARKAGLRIIDSRFASPEMKKALSAPKTPEVELKAEFKPKAKPGRPAKAE